GEIVCGGPTGPATTLGGDVVHVGSEDAETVEIDWGDGSSHDRASNASPAPNPHLLLQTSNQYTTSGKIYLPFLATHQYVTSGTYTITLSATNQSGTTT